MHCLVGASRSVAIVLAYLMAKERMPLRTAWLLVRSRRKQVGRLLARVIMDSREGEPHLHFVFVSQGCLHSQGWLHSIGKECEFRSQAPKVWVSCIVSLSNSSSIPSFPQARPNKGFCQQLVDYEKQLSGLQC